MTKPKKRDGNMECVLCKGKIAVEPSGWDGGYNAEPLSNGRCCLFCDTTLVIEARLLNMSFTLEEAHDMSAEIRKFRW